jgi:FkbM family methyltransferase
MVQAQAMKEPGPLIDAKTLFAGIVKSCKPDLLLDVGSRDGDQSVFLRDLAPAARVAAFEANPYNYRFIVDRKLEQRHIDVYPFAASNENGKATFYIADPATDPAASGASSLLPGGYALKEKIEVETRRLDDFIREHYPEARKIAIWMDVESAEHQVLQGISGLKDRIVAIHTETSLLPSRDGQKLYPDLAGLMQSWGFLFCGSNMRKGYGGGDVVFLNPTARAEMGGSYDVNFWRARLYIHLPIGRTAVFLRRQFPPLYRLLRSVYIRFAS